MTRYFKVKLIIYDRTHLSETFPNVKNNCLQHYVKDVYNIMLKIFIKKYLLDSYKLSMV